MSNLQTIHEHLTLFHDGGGSKGVRKSPLQSLLKVVGSALKIPPLSMVQDAKVVVRKVELKGTEFTVGASFMNDGRFKVGHQRWHPLSMQYLYSDPAALVGSDTRCSHS